MINFIKEVFPDPVTPTIPIDFLLFTSKLTLARASICELGYLNELREILNNNKVVAVGEIGLDYFRNISTPEVQQKVFIEQLELAFEIKKPIVF